MESAKKWKFWILMLWIIPGSLSAQTNKMLHNNNKIKSALSLVVVVSDNWNDSTGGLYTFSRQASTQKWQPVSGPVQVVLGRQGMSPSEESEIFYSATDIKKEGDWKTPAGIFTFGFAFGYADPMQVLFTHMPYLMSNELIECIDDPASKYYNKIVSTDIVTDKDWKSSEKMLLKDARYEWGIEVENNKSPIIPGAGSCIFFHVWADDQRATAGCTAMKKEDLIALMTFLHPDQMPVLIQMPKDAYKALRKSDKSLPKLPR